MMKVNVLDQNPALLSIIKDPNQIITLDANFLIPSDRTPIARQGFGFNKFKDIWLVPIFKAFPNLAIHQAVFNELIEQDVRDFAETKIRSKSQKLTLFKDTDLTEIEMNLRNNMEAIISPLTKYNSVINNKDDRGEVKTLAYIAVKGLLYFAAHDNNAILLVEKAEEWSTGLDNIRAIKMYEIIYYLYINNIGSQKDLRILYKYQYYLTAKEKRDNFSWGEFIEKMNRLYQKGDEKKEI